MELQSNHSAPVLTDSAPLSKSRLGGYRGLMSYSLPGAAFPQDLSVPWRKTGVFDDVRTIGWLDAMISSSPTHKKFTKEINHELSSPDPEVAYRAWLMRFAVKEVAKYFPTAIISGRSRDKVHEFVGLTELYYAGSHGMDIMGPVRQSVPDRNCIQSTDKQGNEVNLFQPAREFLPMIDEVFSSLVRITKDIKGATVENNKFCVSVHYRNVDQDNWKSVWECVQDVIKKYPRLRLTHGRKVLEIRPTIDWDKGKALEFLLESLGFEREELWLWDFCIKITEGKQCVFLSQRSSRGHGVPQVPGDMEEIECFHVIRNYIT
ncbi:TREHALOSE-PHOSPHATE PHOSPHATASE A [Salix viminalis]|uniref:trehalose-phosphatase n=1 Tax=Salix viminalis TaxID=40686 RepID=A0A9Q0NLK3_SALVM|nr:TREHALOSE-PHOSPHATE PHOSPHATASE A [Salix viminalis]